MNDSLYLVIDQSSQSSRALVFDAHGTTMLLLWRAVATGFIAGNRVEQVPADVVNSIRELLVDVAAKLGPNLQRLQSAALVTQRSSLVCWHRQTGEPLSPVISWQDTRAATYLAEIKLDPAAIADLTGLRPNAHYGARNKWGQISGVRLDFLKKETKKGRNDYFLTISTVPMFVPLNSHHRLYELPRLL